MRRALRCLRPLFAAATVATVLALPTGCATPVHTQASTYAAEITKIEMADRRVTLKASMGQLTLRVASGVALDVLKPGDKALFTFGQDGNESIITRIEIVKP